MRDMMALIQWDLQTIVQQYGNKNLHLALAAVSIAMFLFLAGCVFWKRFAEKAGVRKRGVRERLKQVVFCLLWFLLFFLFAYYVCYLLELTLLTREAGSRTDVNLRFLGTWHPDIYSQCFMVENVLL